jgi:hypothetical protein
VGDEKLWLPKAGNSNTSETVAIMALMRYGKVNLKIIGHI